MNKKRKINYYKNKTPIKKINCLTRLTKMSQQVIKENNWDEQQVKKILDYKQNESKCE